MKLNYTVKEEDFGKDLKNIIKTKLFISNRLYIKIKKEGKILVNNNQKYSNYLVTPGDVIQVTIPLDVENDSSFLNKFKPYEIKLDILYEDEYILIVNKPSNMPVHPSSDNYEFTLSNAVASYLKKQKIYTIHIVTRLDKDTTGACIFAKNEYIQDLEKVHFRKGTTNVIKNIDGTFYKDTDDMVEILSKHIVSPVRFDKAIKLMNDEKVDTFVEIGPGKALTGFIKKS